MSKTLSYDELINKTVFPELQKENRRATRNGGNKIPHYLSQNLSKPLRYYQTEGFQHLFLINDDDVRDILNLSAEDLRHNIYHMATGSGKTLMMAGTILYRYKQGCRKFLFLTQSLNLIEKTKDNLLPDRNAKKLEFTPIITIDGKQVQIKEVDKFTDNEDYIEICFKTVHSVHNEIQIPKENSIDYSKYEITLLADEAHHFQANQKGKEDESEKTWESSINIILNSNPKNRLYEFTATLELKHAEIHEKYKNKLIYDYPLLRFRKDGYSKEVTLVKMNDNQDKDRVLLAVITSQFRQHIASKNNIPLVPRVLFKGQGTTEELDQLKAEVQSHIQSLSVESLNKLITNYPTYKIWHFFKNNFKTDLEKAKFVKTLQSMMGQESMTSVHSKNPKKEKERLLKELNQIDENKTKRLIFAINILNEGWDVLSLFDIVKMDDLVAKAKETTSEAQLIGRGARQFPYEYQGKDKYKRKFDGIADQSEELRLLEEMFFYSANDNKYIQALRQSLVEIGLQDLEEDRVQEVRIPVQKRNKLEKMLKIQGRPYIFSNQLLDLDEGLLKLSDYFKGSSKIEHIIRFGLEQEKLIIDSTEVELESDGVPSIRLSELLKNKTHDNRFIFQRALRKLDVISKGRSFDYQDYSQLISELSVHNNELDLNIKIKIEGGIEKFNSLDYEDKFNHILTILNKIVERVLSYKNKQYGTSELDTKHVIDNVFKPYMKSDRYCMAYKEGTKDYHRGAGGSLIGKGKYKIINEDLFLYDYITWDSEEELVCYELFDKSIPEDARKNLLIIRNENEYFKMFSTDIDPDSINIGKGFCPDFVVIRRVGSSLEFYFIEVKPENKDEWKEKLLDVLINSWPKEGKEIEGVVYRQMGIAEFFTKANGESLLKKANLI